MIARIIFLVICAFIHSGAMAEEAVSWLDGSTSWFSSFSSSSSEGSDTMDAMELESRELQNTQPLPDDMEHYALGNLYPMKSLQCYSSLTEPRHRLICPASR